MTDSISFAEASNLIEEHGPQFGPHGVTSVEISGRLGTLCFILAVPDQDTCDRLSCQYEGRKVAGYPIRVEVAELVPLVASIDESPTLDQAPRVLTWVVGIMVLAGLASLMGWILLTSVA